MELKIKRTTTKRNETKQIHKNTKQCHNKRSTKCWPVKLLNITHKDKTRNEQQNWKSTGLKWNVARADERTEEKNEKNEPIEITKHSHKNSTGTFVCYNKRSFWFCTFFLLLNARANKMFDLALTKTNNFLFLHFSMNIYSKMNCAESKNQPLILSQNEETNSVDYGQMENKTNKLLSDDSRILSK